MLPPPTCLSFGLPASPVCLSVCQSNFKGWFRSQGKYRATLEFNSSGCAVSNNVICDSSLSLSVSVKVVHPSLSAGGGGWASNQILKKGGLTGPQLLQWGCWERGGNFFQGEGCNCHIIKSEIFDKKSSAIWHKCFSL